MNEERFRLCWRGLPGFDAVTTGIFTGMALMIGLMGATESRWWSAYVRVALALLGFGLAASESRGALLAVSAGIAWWLLKNHRFWSKLVWPLFGFAAYWILVAFVGQGRSGLVERGSSGRFDIYQSYLSQITGYDWIFGKGRIWMLPESVLGWLVHHPHNAYLGQLAGYGMIGFILMLATLSWAFVKLRKSPEAAILVFGMVTLLFDGGMVFSMYSTARWEALVVMVPLVLPGEEVMVRVKRSTATYSEAEVVEVLESSPDRTEPLCKYFSICGGCQYQHANISVQRYWKKKQVHTALQRIGGFATIELNEVIGSVMNYSFIWWHLLTSNNLSY
jgi:hypothetical protein